jgi:hypothetical protein
VAARRKCASARPDAGRPVGPQQHLLDLFNRPTIDSNGKAHAPLPVDHEINRRPPGLTLWVWPCSASRVAIWRSDNRGRSPLRALAAATRPGSRSRLSRRPSHRVCACRKSPAPNAMTPCLRVLACESSARVARNAVTPLAKPTAAVLSPGYVTNKEAMNACCFQMQRVGA